METYIKKMTEIVKEHYKANHESAYPTMLGFSLGQQLIMVFALFSVLVSDRKCVYMKSFTY